MSGGRPWPVAAAVLAATFLAGVAVGAAGYRFAGPDGADAAAGPTAGEEAPRRGERPDRDGRRGRDHGPTSEMLELLREDVGISDGQEEEIRAILERREDRAREVFEGVRERFHRWMDTTVARVKTVLDEEQAAEFERRLEERLEERREEHRRPGNEDSSRVREGGPR